MTEWWLLSLHFAGTGHSRPRMPSFSGRYLHFSSFQPSSSVRVVLLILPGGHGALPAQAQRPPLPFSHLLSTHFIPNSFSRYNVISLFQYKHAPKVKLPLVHLPNCRWFLRFELVSSLSQFCPGQLETILAAGALLTFFCFQVIYLLCLMRFVEENNHINNLVFNMQT